MNLSIAAFATTSASSSPSMSFFNLVWILPLTSLNEMSARKGSAIGKKLDRFFSLLGEELKTTRSFFCMLSFFKKIISRMSALSRVPIISVPSASSTGRSFHE